MLTNVGGVIETEAKRAKSRRYTNQPNCRYLVDQRQGQIQNLQTLEDKATTAKEGFEAKAGQAVSNDPFIQSMISDTDTFAFFDESPYINRLKNTLW